MASAASINSIKRTGLRYTLSPGVQVRSESGGLLFYDRKGPRLYFFGSGRVLSVEYFVCEKPLEDWLVDKGIFDAGLYSALEKALDDLVGKGVLIADSSRP